ncbi:MAG: MFS transporter [Anaerolineae bacterium]
MATNTMTPDTASLSSTPAERTYRRRIWAWAAYDVADHAYFTTFASAFFPQYFVAIAWAAFVAGPGGVVFSEAQARDIASNNYAFATSLALLLAALIAPILGTYADITGRRKRLLIVITILGGIVSSSAFVLVTGMWELALVIYIITQIAINMAFGLISSLLPHVARADDVNRVSSLGYAMGYIGGGILLLLNTILFIAASNNMIPSIDSSMAVRIAFFTVGIWWIGWMIPTARGVPEPPATPLAHDATGNAIRDTFTRIGHTLRDIQRYRELFKMLIAFWLYSEGIGAIILLASAYGAALGIGSTILIGTLLMTQFVAFPYALIFGRIADPTSKWRSMFVSMLIWTAVTITLFGIYVNLTSATPTDISIATTFEFLAADQLLGLFLSYILGRHLFKGLTDWLDPKRAVILGLIIYIIIPIWGFFLKTQAEFFFIGWMVGTVQGGTQALSRAIYADLSPRAKSGEFFGLYGLSEKFAGILGPLLYGIVGAITLNPRASVFSISIFFVLGILMLQRVDVKKGTESAEAEEAQIEQLHAAD